MYGFFFPKIECVVNPNFLLGVQLPLVSSAFPGWPRKNTRRGLEFRMDKHIHGLTGSRGAGQDTVFGLSSSVVN